jgi:hypothetical protein
MRSFLIPGLNRTFVIPDEPDHLIGFVGNIGRAKRLKAKAVKKHCRLRKKQGRH